MEQNKNHHYSGLTDAEVIASRQKNGVNVLTPPEKETFWDKVKEMISDLSENMKENPNEIIFYDFDKSNTNYYENEFFKKIVNRY